MKKTLLLFAVLLCSLWSFTQQSYSNIHKGYSVNLTSNRGEMLLNFAIDDYKITDVLIDGVKYSKIHFNHGVNTYKKGFAELPMLNATIQLGNENDVQLSVNENDYIDIQLTNPLLPSRGTIYRNQDPKSIPYVIAPESIVDAWYPENLAENAEPFIFRDTRGVNIYVYPFRYNAAKNILRVFKSVFITVKEDNSKSTNALRANIDAIDATMNDVYKSLYINYNPSKFAHQIAELGEMLVIYTARDASAIQPYINWKKQKGFTVHTLEVATGTNVKTNIASAYNSNPNLLYVQLVGDWADIKSDIGTSQSAPMDPMMGCVAGSDNYSELIIGRFSASTAAQVTVQVNKTINYERNPEVDGTWYKNGLGIASSEGDTNGDDSEIDYEHMDIIKNNKLLPFTYTNVASQYDPGASAAGVATAVNGGVSVINYCGHGSETSFVTSGYSNTNVNSSTNGNKLPFIFSVACVNGKFHMSGDCFAEAWLRKENGGAVATLMATINQSWQEPMRGQDYINDILTGGYNYTTSPGDGTNTTIEDKRTTFGSIAFNGNVLMLAQDYSGTNTTETFQTWTIFGDASLQVRTDTPAEMVISHNPTMFLGASTFTVNCDFDGAMVTISYLNEEGNVVVIGSGIAEAGSAVISFAEPVVNPADLTVTVTAFNKIPYLGIVSAVPADEPYVVLNTFTTTVSPNYGAQVGIDVTLENISEIPYTASNVTATITSDSEYVTIIGGYSEVGTIDPAQVVDINGIFEFEIANNVPDQTAMVFNITITGEYNSEVYEWVQSFTIKANAPVITIGNLTIDDAGAGIPGILDPAETANAVIVISNTGHADAANLEAILLTSSEYVTINTEMPLMLGALAVGANVNATAEITADAETPLETNADFTLEVQADEYIANKELSTIIGYIPEYNMSNTAVTACIGKFFDSAGPAADYAISESFTKTFTPSSENAMLAFNFTSFSTESGYDYLYIYNGPSTSSPQIAGSPFHGTTSPGSFTSTHESGAITFKFTSDNMINKPGWAATFECINLNEPPACTSNPTPANNATGVNPAGTLSWGIVMTATSYDIYIGEGSLPAEPTANVSTNSYTPSVPLNEYSSYVWKVVPKNGIGSATGCPTWAFTTGVTFSTILMHTGSVTTCNGIFMDSGGAAANYANSETYTLTINPGLEGANIKVTFTSFDVESNTGCTYDYLKVYNGATTSAPLLGTFCGTTIPGPFTATTGSLTFYFKSDTSVPKAGWAANVTCEGGIAPSFDVTFTITANDEPIVGAVVSVEGEEIVTDEVGVAQYNLAAGIYNYTVTHDSFQPLNGMFSVVNQNVEMPMVMSPLGIGTETLSGVSLFPNPFSSRITLTGASKVKTIVVSSILGQEVARISNAGNENIEIPTAMLSQGVYLVTLIGQANETKVSKMIKR